MKLMIKSLVTILLTGLLVTTASAYTILGPYVQANAGATVFGASFGKYNVESFEGWGWNLTAGYQPVKYFAIQGGVTQYLAFSHTAESVNGAVKIMLPLGDRVNIYALTGYAWTFAKGTGSHILPYLGIGESVKINDHFAINAQLSGVTISFVSLGMLSLGATYHFNFGGHTQYNEAAKNY